jgi:hypothetical protein
VFDGTIGTFIREQSDEFIIQADVPSDVDKLRRKTTCTWENRQEKVISNPL